MAYVSKELKAKIVELAKPILKKYGVRATFGVRHHSTLVVKISEGLIDFDSLVKNETSLGHIQVNPHHYDSQFRGIAGEFFNDLFEALNVDNYDNGDSQSDYFDVGYYVHVTVGTWEKPYMHLELETA